MENSTTLVKSFTLKDFTAEHGSLTIGVTKTNKIIGKTDNNIFVSLSDKAKKIYKSLTKATFDKVAVVAFRIDENGKEFYRVELKAELTNVIRL